MNHMTSRISGLAPTWSANWRSGGPTIETTEPPRRATLNASSVKAPPSVSKTMS
jgi:hypothetical protein